MMNRLTIELESAASLLPTASQVQAARFSVVSGIGGGVHGPGGLPVIAAVHVAVVIRVVPVVGRETKADLTGAVAVRVRAGHRGTRMRVRVAEAVTVSRGREVT